MSMGDLSGLKDTAHIGSRIVNHPAGLDSIAKNRADSLQYLRRNIKSSASFYSPDNIKDHGRGDFLEIEIAKSRKNIGLKRGKHPNTMNCGPTSCIIFQPRKSHVAEVFFRLTFFSLFFLTSDCSRIFPLKQ